MIRVVLCMFVLCIGHTILTLPSTWGGPHGMLTPQPVEQARTTPILRHDGLQRTYVFYRNGVQSIVFRPSFSGNVNRFGILIPFPSPPSMRKVHDDIFLHIAASINPPEVIVRRPRFPRRLKPERKALRNISANPLSVNKVRLIRKDAVGMYQMVVLQAGSPKALNRWMTSHRFQYPKGMDKVVRDYIRAGWCFVAIKVRVTGTQLSQQRPGPSQSTLPSHIPLSGHIQAMGFRFRTPKPVLPMRLAAYNTGLKHKAIHHVIYLLTNGPQAIKELPKRFVVRQLNGTQLSQNLMGLLPFRLLKGKRQHITPLQWEVIQPYRDPGPYNRFAKELFLSDIVASHTKQLQLRREQYKTQLLTISEALSLRGTFIDKWIRWQLPEQQSKQQKQARNILKKMTLTVIDGRFPRSILARQHLSIQPFKMPKKRNHRDLYDPFRSTKTTTPARKKGTFYRTGGPRYASPTQPPRFISVSDSQIQHQQRLQKNKQMHNWLRLLLSRKDNRRARQALRKLGAKAVPLLVGELNNGQQLLRQGWAAVVLSRIGANQHPNTVTWNHLKRSCLAIDNKHGLLRAWACGAWMASSQRLGQIKQLASLYPGRGYTNRASHYSFRGLETILRRTAHIHTSFLLRRASLATLLRHAQHKTLRGMMMSFITRRFSSGQVLHALLKGKQPVERQMASVMYVAYSHLDKQALTKHYLRAIRWKPGATQPPWQKGPLFLPAISGYWQIDGIAKAPLFYTTPQLLPTYKRPMASMRVRWTPIWHDKDTQAMVDSLMRWMLWCHHHKRVPCTKQIATALSQQPRYQQMVSYTLPPLHRPLAWLEQWRQIIGDRKMEAWLKQMNKHKHPAYRLSSLKAQFQTTHPSWLRPKQHLGCFRDGWQRDLPTQAKGNNHTKSSCLSACSKHRLFYAGLQSGGQCFCGNTFGRYGKTKARECMLPCRNKQSPSRCGGAWRNAVFRTTWTNKRSPTLLK